MKSLKWLKFLTLCMAAATVMTLFAFAADKDEYQQQLDDLSSKYDQLEKQQKQLQNSIAKTQNDKSKQLAIKKDIDNQIANTREQISVLNNKITLLESNLEEKEAQLAAKENEISGTYETFKQRLRVMYKSGNASTIGLMLGADDFSDFLTRSKVATRIAEHDRDMMDEMEQELTFIQEAKEDIESNKKEIETAKGQMNEKQNQLGTQLAQTNEQIQDIARLEQDYLANKAQIDKQMKEVQAEVDRIYKEINANSEGDYDGGVMGWPVPNYRTVTSNYGWRFNHTDYHTGIDISGAGVYGKPIVAAASGKVAFVQTNYVPGVGYGIYLIIDHGGKVSTLYGHTSRIVVKVGDHVERGQTIAYVGSTGWSTGPHLHFEVRVNGQHVNPWGYLK